MRLPDAIAETVEHDLERGSPGMALGILKDWADRLPREQAEELAKLMSRVLRVLRKMEADKR